MSGEGRRRRSHRKPDSKRRGPVVTRRAFLGGLGAAAAGVVFLRFGPFSDEFDAAFGGGSSTQSATAASKVSSAMPTGNVTSNGITWKPTVAEDFDTDAATGEFLSTYPSMGAYDGTTDTSGYGLYSPSRVLSVSGSNLVYHLRTVDGQPLVAAVLPDDYTEHTHVRVSIRYRADSIKGYKFVGMMWPSSNDWNDGEIDWPEGDLDGKVRPASAVVGTEDSSGEMTFVPSRQIYPSTDQTAFHVATTEWTAGRVRFYWDDELLATVTRGVPTTPMRVTLQAETWLDQGAPPASASGRVEIDWIVIYEEAS